MKTLIKYFLNFNLRHKGSGMLNIIFGIFLGISGAILLWFASYMVWEYLFEEFTVHAMKKSKLVLANDFLHLNKQAVRNISFIQNSFYHQHSGFNFFVKSSTPLLGNLDSNWLSTSKDIFQYKNQFSTFKVNRIYSELGFVVNTPFEIFFNMELAYIKENIIHIPFKDVSTLVTFLPKEIQEGLCKSFSRGFFDHGWFVIYDNTIGKFLIGICTHQGSFKPCRESFCGVESSTNLIMSGVDLSGKISSSIKQYVRTPVVIEHSFFNNFLLQYIKDNNFQAYISSELKYDVIVDMINKNQFTYVTKEGQVYFIDNKIGSILKCCLHKS